MIKTIGLIFILLCFEGCLAFNPFVKYYQDRTGGLDVTQNPKVIIPADEPQIFRGTDIASDSKSMLENCYVCLGFSSFNGGNINLGDITEQAKQVHAATVIFYSQYTNTLSGSIPLTVPDIKTVTTEESGSLNNSGNIYSQNGSASYNGYGTYNGSSTTTIEGEKTTYIPYSVNRYDYLASFWIKAKMPILGINYIDLSPKLRQQIGSNKGVLITVVVKNSPAFMADILEGDILKKINNTEIIDMGSLSILNDLAGQTVSIELLRNGEPVIKQVQLNTPDHPYR